VAQNRLQIKLDAIDNTKKAFKSVETSTGKLKKALFSLRGVLATIGAGAALRSIANVTANFEDLRDSLSSVTGSAKAGAKAFDFISDFALRSQFSVEDLTTTFITLQASGIKPTEKLLRVFTDTAAVTTDQLGTLQALTRVFSRGVQGGLGLEELNQIADRGVPIFRLLEEEIGITRLEISKFGQTTDGAKKILNALERSLGRTFKDATQQKLDNLSTASSNLGIAFRDFQDTIGRAFFAEALTSLFDSLAKLLNIMKPLAKGIGVLIGAFVKLGEVITNIVISAIQGLSKALDFLIVKYNQILEFFGKKPIKIIVEVDDFDEGDIGGDGFFGAIDGVKEFAETVRGELNTAFETLETQVKNIDEIIGKGLVGGIRGVADGIARSIVLGEKLSDTLRTLAQQILIQLIAKTIEYYALKFIIDVIDTKILKKEKEKVATQQKLNSALKTEVALRAIIAAFGGGGGGGFGFAEGGQVKARADGGGVGRGSPYLVGERGRELFVPNQDGEIVSNERLQNLGATVNFTINATDVKGVKELLIDNRATIVNIINGALNQKGKAALV